MRAVLLLVLVPSTAFADKVILKEGQVIEGRVVSEGAQVVLQIDGGKISFAKSEIKAIEKNDQGPMAQLSVRRSALDGADAKGRIALGRWAKDQGLTAEADVLFGEALELDPNQSDAHLALGHVKHEGKWLSADDYQRAKGMVRYGGRWITAEEATAAEAELKARAEQRRQRPSPAEAPAPAVAQGEQTAWGTDQWIDGPPPLAHWAYPIYGQPLRRWNGWAQPPSAGLNLTITGRSGGVIVPPPRNLAPTAPKPASRGATGRN